LAKPVFQNGTKNILGIQELDRFSESDLQKWQEASEKMDELSNVLFFGTEPNRRRLRSQLIAALSGAASLSYDFEHWVRSVTYQYSFEPLSCVGSLTDIGGRFNAGFELDDNPLKPWPALYIAQDLETAYREKFGLASTDLVDGLRPEELGLEGKTSHSNIVLNGSIERVFDMTVFTSLNTVGSVLRQIKMPREAGRLKQALKIPDKELSMVQNGQQLFNLVTKQNWRVNPRQFGLPSQSQILAELIRSAGFEAILYQSSKGPGRCLAIFPDKLGDKSFVQLCDKPPHPDTTTRLDANSASKLEGWEVVPRNLR
jgi:hypothetical protein